MAHQFSDRIRFNWGFHDGHGNMLRGRRHPDWYTTQGKRGHFDQVYVSGYDAGVAADRDATNSDAAWKTFKHKA